MNKVITAVMGLGLLYAQAVSANEMVRYEHGLFVADAGSAQSTILKSNKAAKSVEGTENTADSKPARVSKSAKHHGGKKHHKHHAKKRHHHHGHKHPHHHNKHHANKHHHKHHRHHHHHRHPQTGCPHAGCVESGMYAPRSASMAYGEPTLEQVEPNMDTLNRERAARSGRGR